MLYGLTFILGELETLLHCFSAVVICLYNMLSPIGPPWIARSSAYAIICTLLPSGVIDSSNTSFETSSKTFFRGL